MTTSPVQVAAQPLWFLDDLAYVHVEGQETHQAFSLVELVGRRGDMPPLLSITATTRRSTWSRAE